MDEALSKLWNQLDGKRQSAIQFKYLGDTNQTIADKVGVPYNTIVDWFRSGGSLEAIYQMYARHLGEERDKMLRDTLRIQDQEWLTHSTNAVRVWAKWNTQERKVPLINKKGEAVFDKNGDLIMVDYIPNIKFSDVVKAFILQRTLENRPARYDPRLGTTSHDQQVEEVIKTLGLTEADFTDENVEKTYERIESYIASK